MNRYLLVYLETEQLIEIMVLTEEYISTLPLVNDEQDGEFYAEGEFEASVLSDFNKEADKIDAQYGN